MGVVPVQVANVEVAVSVVVWKALHTYRNADGNLYVQVANVEVAVSVAVCMKCLPNHCP